MCVSMVHVLICTETIRVSAKEDGKEIIVNKVKIYRNNSYAYSFHSAIECNERNKGC